MKKLLPAILLGIILIIQSSSPTRAVNSSEIDELMKNIQQWEKALAGLQSQDRTLQTEIKYLDTQMTLTQAKIGLAQAQLLAKERELVAIGQDIGSLQTRIARLADAVERQKTAFDARLQAQYKRDSSMPVLELFLSSQSFSEIAAELKYLKLAEIHDQNLINQMSDTQQSYKDQTVLLEIKKDEAVKVKAQIEEQKNKLTVLQAEMVSQSQSKKQLLADTQNDEAKYRTLIDQARAELAAITGAFAGADFSNAKDVKEGDVIAVMGNTGAPSCSTGAHLHFEVRKNGVLQSAENYLKNKTLPYTDGAATVNIGEGDWDWPMKSPIITQRFGRTPHYYFYAGGIHTGIDMVSNESYLIYAPADGKMIKKSGVCGRSTYNYVLIQHESGVESLYLHVQ